MPLVVRYSYNTGASLALSLTRNSDGFIYDWTTAAFAANPVQPLTAFPESSGIFLGLYTKTIDPVPVSMVDDEYYFVDVHDVANNGIVICEIEFGNGASMAANLFQAIPIEAGVTLKQALAVILAAAGGTLSGAGTGNIRINAANSPETQRIAATTDSSGNRSTITLTLPS